MMNCLRDMQAYQCALLRYAGDALLSLYQATNDGDVYAYNEALVRYQASLYALNEVRPHQVDSSSLHTLASNYRTLLRKVVARSPASQRPAISSQSSGMKGTSPIRSFIKQQGYVSEQVAPSPTPITPVETPITEEIK